MLATLQQKMSCLHVANFSGVDLGFRRQKHKDNSYLSPYRLFYVQRRGACLYPMESLNTFESEMEADGQGNYSLFPALDSIASLSSTPETLERLLKSKLL